MFFFTLFQAGPNRCFVEFFLSFCYVNISGIEDARDELLRKQNKKAKGMCSFIEVKLEKQQLISYIFYLTKYFLLCYSSPEQKTIIFKKQNINKKRTSASLLAYSTHIENPIQSFSTLAIFDMTTELFNTQ